MPADLLTQLRTYADQLDAAAPPLEELLPDRPAPLRPPHVSPRRHWPIAVAAAVVTLLLVGGLALLIRAFDRPDPVIEEEEPPPTTTTIPQSLGVPLAVSTIDAAGDVGANPAVAVRPDGRPIVVYVDVTSRSVKLAVCDDAACTGATTTTLAVESGDDLGRMSVSVDPEGRPTIVFRQFEDDLRVIRCEDPMCTAHTDVELGSGQSPVLGGNEAPVIAYNDPDGNLLVASCTDPGCTGDVERTVLATREPDGVGHWLADLALAEDGRPVILYSPDPELRLVTCGNRSCSSGNSEASLVDVAGGPSRLALRGDGAPLIAYVEQGDDGNRLFLLACADPACSNPPRRELARIGVGDVGLGSLSVAFDGEGLPMVLFSQQGDLVVARCGDPQCAGDVTAATIGRVGFGDFALAIGRDGLPVVAYYGNRDLRVAKCGEPQCGGSVLAVSGDPVPELAAAPPPTELWTSTIVAAGDVAFADTNPQLATGPDGIPLALHAYVPGGEEDFPSPALVRCADAACSASTRAVLDVTAFTSTLAVDTAGRAVIASHDFENIRITRCADADCTSATTGVVAEAIFVATPVAVAVGSGDLPLLAYQDLNDFLLKVASCNDAACTSAEIAQIDALTDAPGNWWFNSIDLAVPPGGEPILSVGQDRDGRGEVWFVECDDPFCGTASASILDDSALGDVTVAMELAPDGLPVIAFYADGALKVIKCADSACSSFTTNTIGPALADFIAGVTPSLAFEPDGLPVIGYWDPDRVLVLATCHNPACATSTVTPFADVGAYGLAMGEDGLPVVAYLQNTAEQPEPATAESDLVIAKCTDPACLGR